MPLRRTSISATLCVVLAIGLAACDSDDPPPSTVGTSCNYSDDGQEHAGGPLQRESNAFTFGMNYIKPGSFQDATVIPLENHSDAPVVIDNVDLVPDDAASPVVLDGSFIAPPHTPQRVGKVRSDQSYKPARGYCLAPLSNTEPAPILALRVGPSAPADVDNHSMSRNNSVNVHYRTADGQRYVAAFPIRFEYPNRPSA